MADQCIAPLEIKEGDLSAYLDGIAPAQVADHIARCPACAAEVAALREVGALFSAALYRAHCPSPEELLQYHAGLFTRSKQQQIRRHLKGCADCQRELEQLASPVELSSDLSLVERLKQTGKQILTAFLAPAPQPAFALRGDEKHRRVYQANGYQIILALAPPLAGENIWQIEGQITRGNSSAQQGSVCLLGAGDIVAHDEVDEFGYFSLENVATGRYSLQIELPDMYIVVENLDL